jgi:Kef-type K+ transport system membrane component KefB
MPAAPHRAAFMTEMFGVHAIFGAFLAGLAVPRHHQLPLHLMERIETFISIILLPLYFAYSGLKTDLTLLNTWTIWGLAIMVVVAVSVSKIGR